jgi:DNA-binding transcriptional LysR family regulator
VIPLHLIENFIVYAETQNLAKTAKILQQTQPSASRQIVQFQKYFKRSLFLQKGTQKRLTDYGQEVCEYYKKSILDLRALRTNFSNINIQNQKELLRLAAQSEILQSYILKIQFKSPIELLSLRGEEISKALNERQIDMAVYHEQLDHFDYFRKKLFSTGWKAIIPKTWKPETRNVESWLAAAPPQAFASYDKNVELINRHKLKSFKLPSLNVQFVANDWRLLAEKVQQQECWSIVPQEHSTSPEFISLSMSDQMKETPFYLYFKRELAKNKDVQYIVDQLS